MSIAISSAAIVEKNKLASDGVWLILLKITIEGYDPLLLVRNNADIEWPTGSGGIYYAFPFEIDEIGESSKGEIPQVVVRVSNVTRAIQYYLENAGGGVGSVCTVMVINSNNLTASQPEVEVEFLVTGCRFDQQWVTFTLGASNPFYRRFPKNRFLKNFCRWQFKDEYCGYSGGATTCGRTLFNCKALGNNLRFGNFPRVGTNAVYVTPSGLINTTIPQRRRI